MKNIYLIFSLILFAFFNSCDIIEKPYEREIQVAETNKNVLIEEFTGHTCTNCPPAHAELERLKDEVYGESLIVMSIHSGYFATPEAAPPYDADYRTIIGNAITSNFGIEFNPTGLVNRSKDGNKQIFFHNEWQTQIARVLEEELKLEIVLEHKYNEATRTLNLDIMATFNENLGGTYRYAAFLVEDSLISAQKFPNAEDDDLNYVHRHVLRDVLNSSWTGDVLTDNVIADEVYTKTLNYVVSENYDINHCEVIAYIYNEITDEILQVEKIEILE